MAEDRTVDVVIVGAGPAGTVTAKFAAQAGAKVLVLEKRQEIGTPVRCGEGMSRKWFHEIGIEEDPSWLAHEIVGMRLYSPGGNYLTIDEEYAGKEAGIVVNRDIFDRALARDAVLAGAEILVKAMATGLIIEDGVVKGVEVTHMGETFKVRANIVVGADGFESRIGRWAGIDTSLSSLEIISCFEYQMVNIDIDPKYCYYYIDANVPGGYIWIFPKGKDIANVGLGIALEFLTHPGEIRERLDAWIAARPAMAKGEAITEIAGAVSSCGPMETTVTDGLLLVGDAARQIDPLTGGGVCNTCHCAKIAGEVIGDAIAAGNYSKEFLKRYDERWHELYEEEMYRNLLAKEMLIKLDDEVLDKVVDALKDCDIGVMSTLDILQAVQNKYPELVETFSDLL